MARIILVTGGCRSGKSGFALKNANQAEGDKYFLATCPRLDAEMDERILQHKKEREGFGWKTIEEETNLLPVFQKLSPEQNSAIVLDCLSLWINNLMFQAENIGKPWDQDKIQTLSKNLGNKILSSSFRTCYLVTSEVGLGLVPENKQSRLYRDLLGICNQTFAALSEEVYLLVSGIAIQIKRPSEGPPK